MRSAFLEHVDSAVTERAVHSAPDITGPWHVLRTRSRQEKALAADLAAMDISYFLPVVCQERQYGAQRVRVSVPVHPGYVFLCGSTDHACAADATQRVAQIIPVADQRQLDWELRNLKMALSTAVSLDPHPHLQHGIRVEVRTGPLRGVQGLIHERDESDCLILQVNMLASAVSLKLDDAMLAVIN